MAVRFFGFIFGGSILMQFLHFKLSTHLNIKRVRRLMVPGGVIARILTPLLLLLPQILNLRILFIGLRPTRRRRRPLHPTLATVISIRRVDIENGHLLLLQIVRFVVTIIVLLLLLLLVLVSLFVCVIVSSSTTTSLTITTTTTRTTTGAGHLV
jgi:hypothetical protein